jgi:hypothetical protein
VAAATTSDWKLRAIPLQARIAVDLAAAEPPAKFTDAPAALTLIASATKPRSAAIVARHPVVMHMLGLLFRRDASDRERL